MEKRLTLDQFKKSVGTQNLELQKLSVRGLGSCHPSGHTPTKADSIAAQVIIDGYNKLKDAFGL
ncbi:hypothetical protein HX13_01280 [Chryseobacterium sp. P1-3]|uniref:hypothetical protein n=1 Tax=Chryseobacterium sp. (strain P1-3) TaxID=1517683 RepID=UPI0004E79328|nr:hypothetical protein [Chryseobacterium sp. P1-3]KFF76013.1 hypothetical protein HX13_01280 [Chryseobacterium sp. P1-3]